MSEKDFKDKAKKILSDVRQFKGDVYTGADELWHLHNSFNGDDKDWEQLINYCQGYEWQERETQLPIMLKFLNEHYSLIKKS